MLLASAGNELLCKPTAKTSSPIRTTGEVEFCFVLFILLPLALTESLCAHLDFIF